MAKIGRVIRVFFQALALTLRGQSVEAPILSAARARFPALTGWCEETVVRVDSAIAAAEAAGWTDERRAAFTLHLEGRDVSLKVMLATVRYHGAHEIPHLLASASRYTRVGVRALAINDHYWAQQFSAAETLPPAVQAALASLAAHLAAPPDEREPETVVKTG
ncbi:MAG: hypothetical protein ACUVS2_10070 [Candidatus Flexifilum sp.]|jgi:hypothetical protein